jgi:hypothetical protein
VVVFLAGVVFVAAGLAAGLVAAGLGVAFFSAAKDAGAQIVRARTRLRMEAKRFMGREVKGRVSISQAGIMGGDW